MKKLILFALLFCFLSNAFVTAQTSTVKAEQPKYTVGDALSLLKGEWRFMYKIVEEQIVYNRSFRHGAKGYLQIDTMEVHTYNIDALGRTEYFVDWEDPDGSIKPNEANSSGSWDLEKVNDGIDIVIKDAYFKGCPDIRRRVLIINSKQMLLLDIDTGDKHYYKNITK